MILNIINNNPLVSITVLTYNSSKYVIETLESIKEQTYKNIELIISDDCSTDNSVEICEKWIYKNKSRFEETHLIKSKVNTGIPANKNRALTRCKGLWLKGIAGDDALYKDAIDSFIQFINKHKKVSILSSNVAYFNNTFDKKNMIKIRNDQDKKFYKISAFEQYNSLLNGNQVHALGAFIKKELIDNVGGYDEKYRLLEDHPMWLKITKSGHKFYYMNEVTVKYRIHDASIFSTTKKEFIFNRYYLAKREFDKDYILPNISTFYRISLNYTFYQHKIFDFLNLNKKNYMNIQLYKLSNSLNPKAVKNYTFSFLRKMGLLNK